MDFVRRPKVLAAIGVVATLILALIVVIALLLTGGGSSAVSDNAALIGALIALGGVFTTQMVNAALEDQRAQQAHKLEEQRAYESALRAYLDRMGNLLTEEDLLSAQKSVGILARAHTLAVLEGLDPTRKRVVLQFLRESDLIPRRIQGEQDKIVDLSGANLRDADLSGLNLREAGLDGAFLERANLRKAHLPDADLGGTRLYGADLTDANLHGASLRNARLQSRPDLRLRAANLSGTDLSNVDLSGANLNGANVSKEQLDTTRSLERVTMPDGSKHD